MIDMDGTLYDVSDLIEDGFNTSVNYLIEFYEFDKEDAEEALIQNHIYPYVSEDARSTTGFFISRGIDMTHWDAYRSEHFGYRLIDNSKAMSEESLKKLADIAPLVLLTNNTRINVKHVLDKINVSEDIFMEIFCNENEKKTPSKKTMMEELLQRYNVKPEEALSIGDRFDVDAKPMIELGGRALILLKPQAIDRFLDEIDNPQSCDVYSFYPGK